MCVCVCVSLSVSVSVSVSRCACAEGDSSQGRREAPFFTLREAGGNPLSHKGGASFFV